MKLISDERRRGEKLNEAYFVIVLTRLEFLGDMPIAVESLVCTNQVAM